MDAFIAQLPMRTYYEHAAFWRLKGPMGIQRLDLLIANLFASYAAGKTGKAQPLKDFMLPFGEDQKEAEALRKQTKLSRLKAWAFQRSPEVVAKRKQSHKDAALKRKQKRGAS